MCTGLGRSRLLFSHFEKPLVQYSMGNSKCGSKKMDPTLLFKMLLRPLASWYVAGAVYLYLKVFVVGSLSENSILVGLAENISSISIWIALVPFGLGLVQLLERIQLIYSWHSNKNRGCDFCGGPQNEKIGRFGPYRKCFRCGKTQRGWE